MENFTPLRQLLMWISVKGMGEDIYVAQDFIKQTSKWLQETEKWALEMLNNTVNIVLQIRLCKDGIYGSSWSY